MANEPQRIFAEFYMEAIQDEKASLEQGRPIYNDVEHVRIRWAGDNKRELVAPAQSMSIRDRTNGMEITYAERFPREYEAFKSNIRYVGSGTPLDEAPFLTAANRAELKALNIFTIEALANPTSQAIQRLGMGGRTLVNKAAAWLQEAAEKAPALRFAAENAELKNQLASMQKQMADFMAGQRAPVAPMPDIAPASTSSLLAPATDEEIAEGSAYAEWSDDRLKAFIKDKSGQAPRGTPSHVTLVRMAEEVMTRAAA